MIRLWLDRRVEMAPSESDSETCWAPTVVALLADYPDAWVEQVDHSLYPDALDEIVVVRVGAPAEAHDAIRAVLGDECDLGEA